MDWVENMILCVCKQNLTNIILYIKNQQRPIIYISQGGLRRPKLTRHDMLCVYIRFLECHLTATCWIPIQGKFFNFLKNTPILNMKHNIYAFSLSFEDFVFRIQRILKYPRIQMFADWLCKYLYTMKHTVENIAYYRW